MPQLKVIPLDNVISDPKAGGLREVQKDHEKFPILVESIGNVGVLQPISVRWNEDLGKYTVIDGHQRTAAAKEAGLREIPAQIFEIEDDATMVHQVIANLARIETKPIQYSRQLQRIMMQPRYQTYSRQELMAELGVTQSLNWFNQQFSLQNLIPETAKLVDEGVINITNAYWLAKLPADEQVMFAQNAQEDDVGTFATKVGSRIQELKNAKKGLAPEAVDPLSAARGRKLGELKKRYVEVTEQLTSPSCPENKKEYLTGLWEGLAYSIQLDKATLDQKQAQKDAKKKEHEDEMKARREKMKALQAQVEKLGGVDNVVLIEKK